MVIVAPLIAVIALIVVIVVCFTIASVVELRQPRLMERDKQAHEERSEMIKNGTYAEVIAAKIRLSDLENGF